MNLEMHRALQQAPLRLLPRKSLDCYNCFIGAFSAASDDMGAVLPTALDPGGQWTHGLIRREYDLPDLLSYNPTNLMNLVCRSDDEAYDRYLALVMSILEDSRTCVIEPREPQCANGRCRQLRLKYMKKMRHSVGTRFIPGFPASMEELVSELNGYDYAVRIAGVETMDESLFDDFGLWLSDYHGLPRSLRWDRIITFCNILGPIPPRPVENCFQQFELFLRDEGSKYEIC